MAKTRKSRKSARAILYYGLLTFFVAVFLGSAFYVGSYLYHSKQNADAYASLQEQMQEHLSTLPSRPIPTTPAASQPAPSSPTEPSPEPTEPAAPTEPQILPEYRDFCQENGDMVGWICIPGTKVNYPVMQTPTDPDYYLKHRFDRQWSDWGCIYVRSVCDVFAPSDNLVIYGHHMKDGSMFAGLDAYKSRAYWENNQYLFFDTLYERHTYRVFAAFKTSANADEGYRYHVFNDAADPAEFDDFVRNVKQLSFYDTGITPEYGDKLITLSTCEYTLVNGRFVVVALRVD